MRSVFFLTEARRHGEEKAAHSNARGAEGMKDAAIPSVPPCPRASVRDLLIVSYRRSRKSTAISSSFASIARMSAV